MERGSGRRPPPCLLEPVAAAWSLTRVLLALVLLCCLHGDPALGQNASVLRLSVREEQVPDTEVGRVSQAPGLSQALSSLQGGEVVRYSLLDEGYPHSHLFHLHNTSGLLTTNATLDREQLCQFSPICLLQLEVVIQSVTTIQFFRKQRVDVEVVDVNDHAPTFPQPDVALALSEGDAVGTTWALDGALDRDVGDNAALSYSLQPDSGHFALHVARWLDGSFKLELALTRPLDREEDDHFNLTVVARDNGTPAREGHVIVNITVTDINDNPPRFQPAVYNVTVAETAERGAHVVQLTAIDADSPQNGIDYFRFSPLVSRDVRLYFDVNHDTGEVTVKRPLSAVQSSSFRLVAECVDRGVPPLLGQAEVVVNVLDSANSPPQVNLNLLFNGRVSEMAQRDTVVAHVDIRDPDTGINGIVRCETNSDIVGLTGLEETEYKVVLRRSLAGRAGTTYNVTLTCSDSGQPPLSQTLSFPLVVTAANDNAPTFSQSRYTVRVSEDVQVGTVIFNVTASDPDAGVNGRVTYIIPDATVGFAVTSSGAISVTRSLDRERTPSMEFQVVARDGGERPRNSSCRIEVVVTDVNDETPVFRRRSHEFSVSEDAAVGYVLGSVAADDLDEGDNGRLDYSVRHAAPTATSPPFDVTADGTLKIASPLDREKVDVYDLIVTASDRGATPRSASIRVRVVVLDVNDNAPVFLSPSSANASLNFGLDVPVGTVLMKVSAEDRDTDRNGKVSYSLEGAPTQTMLALNRLTGELTMTRRLTIGDLGGFTVVLRAEDGGDPPQATDLTLTVNVANVNHSAAASGEGDEAGGINTTVVVTLGCLTGLVLVAVVITIVVIKMADRRKRRQKQRNYEPSHVTMTPVDTGFPDLGDEGARRESTSRQDAAEVSFESCSGSHSTAGTGNSETRLVKHDSLDSGYQGKVAYSKPLAGHHTTLDDLHSDSSGEATASDSGRGGSEDDFHHQDRNSPFFRKDGGGPPGRVYPERRPPPAPGPTFSGGWCQPLEIVSSNFTRGQSPQTFGVTFGKAESDLERSSSSLSSHSLAHPSSRPPPVLPRVSSHRHPQPPGKHVSFSSDVEMSGFPPRRPSSHASRSYDSGEDGNSTTTSGSYTLTLEPTDSFHPRIRDALV